MTLKQYIKSTYKEGRIFSFKDLPEKYRKPSSIVQLSRFVKTREIGRLMKGVYYIPQKGKWFDKLPPSPLQIDSFICKKYDGYVSGHGVFNAMGLTEQVPSITEIYCRKKVLSITVAGTRIRFKKAYVSPKNKDITMLQILDAIGCQQISGKTTYEVTEKLKTIIDGLTDEKKKKLKSYAKAYPQKTIYRLSTFL